MAEALGLASSDAGSLPDEAYGRALLRVATGLNASAVAVVLDEVKVVTSHAAYALAAASVVAV